MRWEEQDLIFHLPAQSRRVQLFNKTKKGCDPACCRLLG
jgi:hypothetical protein